MVSPKLNIHFVPFSRLPRKTLFDRKIMKLISFSARLLCNKEVKCFFYLFYCSIMMNVNEKTTNVSCLIWTTCDFASHQTTWHNNRIFNNELFNSTTLFIVWKLQAALILKLVPGTSFACAKTFHAIAEKNLLLLMKIVA